MTEKIVHIPVKPRALKLDRVLEVVPPYNLKCQHKRFIVDDKLECVECRDCGERLNPMFALVQLARKETGYHELHERYQDELARLSARQKTKCRNCGHMTVISKG